MSVEADLRLRANNKCELTAAEGALSSYVVAPKNGASTEECIMVLTALLPQLEPEADLKANDWHGLRESIWSEIPAVQVVAYRLLQRLALTEDWARDLLDVVYLEEATQAWAELGSEAGLLHKDSNGQVLAAGDTVVLIKDLKVKGGGFTAKRGTAVRRISLVADNPEHIEGKIEGQRIVILTQYVKKSK